MAKPRKKTSTTKPAGPVSRRSFIQGVIAASAATAAVSSSASSVLADAPVAGAEGVAYKVLTGQQGEQLAMVLNRLVPGEGNMPGAGDLGVARFIDEVMADAPHLRGPVFDVLNRVQATGAFALGGDELDGALAVVEQEQKASFTALIDATYTGYYTHPDVMAAIGVESPSENIPEVTFDATMLEDVIRRGPIFRNV